jgi:hypothetical protein
MGVPTDHAVYLQRRGYAPPWPGAFTAEETALLDRFGHWMQALAAGAIAPVTPEQRHFMQVVRGEVEPASPFEHVWVKLRLQQEPAAPTPAPAEEPPVEPPAPGSPVQLKFEELVEARSYLDTLRQRADADREAILSAVRAQLDELEARVKPELEDAERAVEELEAELRAEVVRTGKSARVGNIQAVYYRGRVTWDGKGLQQYAEKHPELERFRKVGQPGVAIRYK